MAGETACSHSRLDLYVLCLIAAVIFYQIMMPPIVGIADNGDFARVMGRFGLGHLPGEEVPAQDAVAGYSSTKYRFSEDAFWNPGFQKAGCSTFAFWASSTQRCCWRQWGFCWSARGS